QETATPTDRPYFSSLLEQPMLQRNKSLPRCSMLASIGDWRYPGAMSQALPSIAFLGIGIMGLPMARRLCQAGYPVAAWNRTPEKAVALEADGAVVAGSAAVAAEGRDVVVVMLTDGPACDAMLTGEGKVLAAMPTGATLLVMSSIPVETARRLADAAASRGVAFVDAPVSGGEIGAQQGSLAIMAGGEAEALQRLRPVLDVFGRTTHVGPAGSGALAKIANQMIVGITIGAVAEALLLAKRGGADVAAVRQALLGGFAGSRILDVHGQRMIDGSFAPGAYSTIQLKDMGLATELAGRLEVDLPLSEATRRLYEDLVAHGDGRLDHSALYREIERRAREP
ncbi:MAG: NAD(P)-dependent oxidoreductase, partial [Acetobacterales bacterium]